MARDGSLRLQLWCTKIGRAYPLLYLYCYPYLLPHCNTRPEGWLQTTLFKTVLLKKRQGVDDKGRRPTIEHLRLTIVSTQEIIIFFSPLGFGPWQDIWNVGSAVSSVTLEIFWAIIFKLCVPNQSLKNFVWFCRTTYGNTISFTLIWRGFTHYSPTTLIFSISF